jgi:hypothetical protein
VVLVIAVGVVGVPGAVGVVDEVVDGHEVRFCGSWKRASTDFRRG